MELVARLRNLLAVEPPAATRRHASPVEQAPPPPEPWHRRVADIGLAVLLLLVALPILIAAAAAILILSGRPVFYGHVRVGRYGRPFRCWKLRTMQANAESWLEGDELLRRRYVHNGYKLPSHDDPRVTRIGRLIRRTYLDELPQLLNVLNGTMSMIGPRPVIAEELREFEPHVNELLAVRPGILGAWTSRGRARPGYPERARIEIDYIRNRNPRTDASILLRSLLVVLRGQQPDA